MVSIIFEAHSTSLDNENHLSSGQFDVVLSPIGEKQAKQLGERYKNAQFAAIFCSDLQRSYKTAEISFDNKFPIVKDKRLWLQLLLNGSRAGHTKFDSRVYY